MLLFYKILTWLSGPFLKLLLRYRLSKGKEHPQRLYERQGQSSLARPNHPLIWIHAASVGEAQSALILIEKLSAQSDDYFFLITSGTVTSADLMAKRLPHNAYHQFMPLDHPLWVHCFLTHWHPDVVLWMESELWPNMLTAIKKRDITAFLINARLSDKSYKKWAIFKSSAQEILSTFQTIFAQTPEDQKRFNSLGLNNVIMADNIKYSATPLPHHDPDLTNLQNAITNRPIWLYASTHDGEETLAARVHAHLKTSIPDLLTIIVPRHPERRGVIKTDLKTTGHKLTLRGDNKNLPTAETDIYIADTLGELGLFYRLCPIAMIGRSFSHDGGGGHNPIEAAQLNCAVLTGPRIQYQQQLFDDMFTMNAAIQLQDESALQGHLNHLLTDQSALDAAIKNAQNFATSKKDIADNIIAQITPALLAQSKAA